MERVIEQRFGREVKGKVVRGRFIPTCFPHMLRSVLQSGPNALPAATPPLSKSHDQVGHNDQYFYYTLVMRSMARVT